MEIGIVTFLVVLATVLLIVEVLFVPGLGMAGIAGGLAMIGSVLYAFFKVSALAGWVTMLLAVLICIALFMWALYGKSLDKLALKKNLDSKLDVGDIKKFAVGDKGVTRTRLALIGEAEFNGEPVEVKSEMGYIKEGEPVEIIRIVGEAIYVKKVTNK